MSKPAPSLSWVGLHEGKVRPTGWVNVRSGAHYDVFVGRPSRFGNPFKIGRDGTRSEVIAKYKVYVMTNPVLLAWVAGELPGKVLGCYCWPNDCHARILWEIANPPKEVEKPD